jgi:predicted flap endonuclease-1-like 5' DNA nuclease
MQVDLVSGLVGAAAGWAGQWFLIDKPIYRKTDGGSVSNTMVGATVGGAGDVAGLTAKLEKCNSTNMDLLQEIERLKGELSQTSDAYASCKTELAGLRGVVPDSDVRDDLEVIIGIGPVFERKLYDAKVYTFKQLSEMTPEAVTKIIAPQKWQKIEPAEWIAEAAKLAKGG